MNRSGALTQQVSAATQANEDAIIRAKIPLALSMAARVVWQHHVFWIESQDVAQEGLIGFLRAVRRYQPGAASLNTYAMDRLEGAMLDAIRPPRNKCMRACRMPENVLCELDAALDIAGDDGRKWSDSIAIKQICSAFDLLPDQQRDVMRLIYIDGLQNREAARELGISEGRVSQIHKAAIKKLRKKYGH